MISYVSEEDIPKTCFYCEYERICSICDSRFESHFYTGKSSFCPLRSLEQHDKEVRKLFVEKLIAEINNKKII